VLRLAGAADLLEVADGLYNDAASGDSESEEDESEERDESEEKDESEDEDESEEEKSEGVRNSDRGKKKRSSAERVAR